jgi:glyoxylase-like metal-dependent hydrolase (beta-lactamase superfamily II)
MKLTTIHTGNFKLDGGAMFGVVPKVLWNKMNPSDDNNLCNWAMRCLLIEVGSRKILIDTGIGNKQSDKFFSHYYLNGDQSLDKSLAQLGLTKDDITDVILTHLHFDHVGGAVTSDLTPAFSNAIYHVTQIQWNHANNPNPREKASFLLENFEPLLQAGVLNFVQPGDRIADVIEVLTCNGHTLEMITPLIHLPSGEKVLYGTDLYPSHSHIKSNFVMAYDIQPLVTMVEKEAMNQRAIAENWWIYYEHDLAHEMSKIALNEKNQFEAVNFATIDLLN